MAKRRMRRKNERESRGYDDIVRIRYDRKQPEHDWLKHFRVVRYWVKRNYELTLPDLEMLLFLYSERLFTRTDFNEFEELFSWDVRRFDKLRRDGWIHVWRKAKGSEPALYEVTRATRQLIDEFYKKLSGESPIAETDRNNVIFKKNSPYTDKVYRRAIKRMNKETKLRRQRPSRE